MSHMHAHELHQMVRSWLLAEDPYGVNQRQEPTFDTPAPAGAGAPAAGAPQLPSRPIMARDAGERAVEKALKPPEPPRYSEAASNPRAEMWGRQAVGDALASNPRYSEAARDPRAQMWGEQAVDEATAKPGQLDMSGAPGYASPEEAQMTASAAGQGAVARALARGKIARGGGEPKPMFAPARTSDPLMPHPQTRARSPGKTEEDDTPTE